MYKILLPFLCFLFLSFSVQISAREVRSLDNATLKNTETIVTPYGEVKLVQNYPTDKSSVLLFDLMDTQRAGQIYMWATPVMGFASWKKEQAQLYGADKFGDFVIFESLKEKRGIVTANLTTPYIISFMNLKQAPIIIDYPAGDTQGSILDIWQRPVVTLVGSKSKGERYIIVGPEENIKDYSEMQGVVVQSHSNNILLGLRILDTSPKYMDQFTKALKVNYLGETPVKNRFIKGLDKEWSATPPRGMDYWEMLAEIINEEPVRKVDKIMLAMLAPLGIRKGATFVPNARQIKILKKGAVLGELFSRNIQVNPRFAKPYWPETNWYNSFGFLISQETDTMLQIDERTTWFYEAVTSTEQMMHPKVGVGQVYLTSKRDNKGQHFRADKTYRLHVPAHVPVEQFWSLTLYSEQTRRPYDNGGTDIKSISFDSRMKQLKYNSDGSIDLYIGAKAPKGSENNFLKTVGEDGWFTYFRLYAPTEPFFDKSFYLSDFEMIQ